MSKTVHAIFGETTSNTTKSLYTYANALTFDIMEILGEDERFIDCNQADVLNLALVMLYGFVAPRDHDRISKAKLHDFVEDFKEFKDFALFSMNSCRQNNAMYNLAFDDIIEKETAQ